VGLRSTHQEAEPWGSLSTKRTRCFSAKMAARLTAVVVLPTPPLPFTTAKIRWDATIDLFFAELALIYGESL
jgi:hypothetical protein